MKNNEMKVYLFINVSRYSKINNARNHFLCKLLKFNELYKILLIYLFKKLK